MVKAMHVLSLPEVKFVEFCLMYMNMRNRGV